MDDLHGFKKTEEILIALRGVRLYIENARQKKAKELHLSFHRYWESYVAVEEEFKYENGQSEGGSMGGYSRFYPYFVLFFFFLFGFSPKKIKKNNETTCYIIAIN
ncbi:hypothetical protein ACFL2U_02195 [Patescibacteria group bacterium]